MTDIQKYIEKLKALGYSNDEANSIIALHLNTGTIDILESSLSENYIKNK